MKVCREFKDSYTEFYLYIYGYFEPWIDQQRAAGKLKKGKSIKIHNIVWIVKTNFGNCQYDGEMYKDSSFCGHGVKSFEFGRIIKGTWLNDEYHGVCKWITDYI